MSQVSLLFREKILSIHHLDQHNDFIIGHDPACQIHIDSLAVSARHAKIVYEGDHTYIIQELEDEAPILVNNKKINSSTHLSDGDRISLGKHTLIFTFDERNENHDFREPEPAPKAVVSHGTTGWVQYLNGKKMGKTIQIKQNMTNITDDLEDNIALISNRSDGFYISYLKGEQPPTINSVSIGEKSTRLANNSKIFMGSQEILFYID